jgi:hypothetical protein
LRQDFVVIGSNPSYHRPNLAFEKLVLQNQGKLLNYMTKSKFGTNPTTQHRNIQEPTSNPLTAPKILERMNIHQILAQPSLRSFDNPSLMSMKMDEE